MLKNLYKALIMFAALIAFSTSNAVAAECNGKSKSSCSSDKSCTYVSGYNKKDGTKVKGYCRAKGNSGSTSSKKSKDSKSSTTKSKESKSKSTKSKDSKSTSSKSKDTKSKDKKSKDKKSKDKKSKDKKSKDTKTK